MRRRTCTPTESKIRRARVEIKKRLSELADYMDTLDQTVWDALELGPKYNSYLDTINELKYNSTLWEEITKDEENDKG